LRIGVGGVGPGERNRRRDRALEYSGMRAGLNQFEVFDDIARGRVQIDEDGVWFAAAAAIGIHHLDVNGAAGADGPSVAADVELAAAPGLLCLLAQAEFQFALFLFSGAENLLA